MIYLIKTNGTSIIQRFDFSLVLKTIPGQLRLHLVLYKQMLI